MKVLYIPPKKSVKKTVNVKHVHHHHLIGKAMKMLAPSLLTKHTRHKKRRV